MAGRFGSVITAMVTPFRDDHALDLDRAQELSSWLVRNGSDSVVIAGSTGESPTVTHKEKADLFRAVAEAINARSRTFHCPPSVAVALARIAGAVHRDIALTRDELAGLQAGVLASSEPPRGTASFRSWLALNGTTLGRRYASELARNFRGHEPL